MSGGRLVPGVYPKGSCSPHTLDYHGARFPSRQVLGNDGWSWHVAASRSKRVGSRCRCVVDGTTLAGSGSPVNEVSAFAKVRRGTAAWATEMLAAPVFAASGFAERVVAEPVLVESPLARAAFAEKLLTNAVFASGALTKPGPTKVALGEKPVACLLARSPFFGSDVADDRWRRPGLEKPLARDPAANRRSGTTVGEASRNVFARSEGYCPPRSVPQQ
jgi:hypothetical protein